MIEIDILLLLLLFSFVFFLFLYSALEDVILKQKEEFNLKLDDINNKIKNLNKTN